MTDRVLVVEDSRTQAVQLQLNLEEAGFSVSVAEHAEQAVELLRNTEVDLVVSDIMLPGASGFDLCAEIKLLRPNLPVIMLSTLNNSESIILALQSGADYFLTKPYQTEHLVRRIRTALSTANLRLSKDGGQGVNVVFRGTPLSIGSSKEQMLGLLLSIFEDMQRRNVELEDRTSELARTKVALEHHMSNLETIIAQRTQEILQRQQQLSDAQKMAQMGDWRLDVSAWKFVRSPEVCSLLGLENTEENVAKAIIRLHPDDRDVVQKIFVGAIETKRDFRFEARFIAKPGHEERNLWVVGHPRIDPSGKVVELFGIMQDITDRKRMELQVLESEEQLYKAQKMEAIGQLTGGMSHDFNNLLSVIIGNLDLAREETSSPLALECIDEAIAASQRGAELNQRLLAFARRQSLQPQPTDVNEVVSTTAQLLDRILGNSVALQLNLSEALPAALIDPTQLESALLNLSINARDAMPNGGQILVRTKTENLSPDNSTRANLPAGQYIVVEVADTGCGMSREVLERACDPFFTTKEVGKGSGLGLSMVSGFLQQSGGALQIDSRLGEGTRMRLFMPTAEGEAPVSHAEGMARGGKHRGVVLAVDDNDQLRSILVKQLKSLGYDPLEASSGDAALEIIRGPNPIDILLTDVVMPGAVDGVQLVEEARKERPELCIIVSSGFPDSMIGKNIHGISFLKKPYKKSELFEILSKAS